MRSGVNVRLVAACAVVVLAAGCGGSGGAKASDAATSKAPSAPAAGAASPGTAEADTGSATIVIQHGSFGKALTVNPGEPITVVNKDTAKESVTSGKDLDITVPAGGTASVTAPSVPGTYPLTSKFSPALKGSLVVRGM